MKSTAFWLPYADPKTTNNSSRESTAAMVSREVPAASSLSLTAIRQRLVQWGQTLASWLLTDTEPQIIEIPDGNGGIWWHVKDPATGQYYWFSSEAEVLIWLDNCRYR